MGAHRQGTARGRVQSPPICLIRPPAVETFRFATTSITLPLGLAYVAAALEESGRRVQVVDAVGEQPTTYTRYIKGFLVGLPVEAIVQRVPEHAEIVGISVIFTHEWPAVVQLIEGLKAARPELFVVLGGEHVTAMPSFCLRTSQADAVVLGEGEETVVALVDAVKNERPLAQVDGLAFRDGTRLVVTPRRQRRRDVDAIPTPAWHLFDVANYNKHRFVGGMWSARRTMPILATRGCPYQCTYCAAPNMWTPQWIARDPVKVVDEIESYVRRYGARNFPFQDLTAIIKKSWILAFCRELLARRLDITWQLPTGTRSEAIDAEVAVLLKATGMISLAYAPESGSEETRRLIKKQMRTDRLLSSIEAAIESDLNVAIFMVIGFPHDDPESLAENLPFLEDLASAGVTDCSVGFYMALPGTELFSDLIDRGRLRIDRAYFRHILSSLQLVPSQSYCDSLSRTELALWKLRMFARFYRSRPRSRRLAGVLASLRSGISGLFSDGAHASKLQTALRNAADSALVTLEARFRPNWLSRVEEERMFRDWDAIYRDIRTQTLAQGVALTAAPKLHGRRRSNVVPLLRKAHSTRYTLQLHGES